MDLRTDYRDEIRLFRSTAARVWAGAGLAILLLVPAAVERYLVYLLALAATHVVIAIGLNLLTGYAGQVSLGHAGFMAIGAYGSALLMLRLQLPFAVALPAAGLIAAAFGFLLGFPALRLTGPYLAVATLGFGIAVTQILVKWEGLSGGSLGIHPPPPSFGPLLLRSDAHLYYLALAIGIVLAVGGANLVNSRLGRAFIAIRESEVAAQAMGVDLTLYKTLAFAVSAFYAGIGGALMGHLVGFISPDSFNPLVSIYILSMIVIGGLASIVGSILGAVILTVLTYLLSEIKNLSMVLYGAFLVVVAMREPHGLRGRWEKIRLYWRTWPF
jgi:branched-chain amino acid transport system permease protein